MYNNQKGKSAFKLHLVDTEKKPSKAPISLICTMMSFLSQLIKRDSIRSRPWILTFHLPREKKNHPSKSKQTKRKTLLRDSPRWWVLLLLFFWSCFLKNSSSVSFNFGIFRVHSIVHATHLSHLKPKVNEMSFYKWGMCCQWSMLKEPEILENVRDREHQMGRLRPREMTSTRSHKPGRFWNVTSFFFF